MSKQGWKKTYAALWTGQALELVETSITNFALSWYYADVTGSATILATLLALAQIPQIFISPFAGVIVDRFDRRKILIVTDAVVAFTFLVLGFLFHTGDAPLIFVYGMVFITATCSAFAVPALQATIPLIVPPKRLTRLVSLGQIITAIPSVIGPVAGALLIKLADMSHVLYISCGIALLAIVPLLFIRVPHPIRVFKQRKSYWEDMVFGLRYIVKWKALLGVVAIGSLCNFLIMPPSQLLPLIIAQADSSADLYASVQAVMVVGLVAMAVWMSFIGKGRQRGLMMSLSQLGMGTAVLLLWAPFLPIGPRLVAGGLMFGIFASMYNVSLAAIVAAEVAPEVQGRVMSVGYSLLALASPISLAVAGPAADAVGLGPVYIISGGLLLVMGFMILRLPLFRAFNAAGEKEAAE